MSGYARAIYLWRAMKGAMWHLLRTKASFRDSSFSLHKEKRKLLRTPLASKKVWCSTSHGSLVCALILVNGLEVFWLDLFQRSPDVHKLVCPQNRWVHPHPRKLPVLRLLE